MEVEKASKKVKKEDAGQGVSDNIKIIIEYLLGKIKVTGMHTRLLTYI